MLMHLGNAYRNPSKPAKIQGHLVFQLSPNLQNVASTSPQKSSASQPQKLDSIHVIDYHFRFEVIRALVL
jgi:hypothetical protein